MAIKEYDLVILKDGREAAIVDVLGNGKEFLADVGDAPDEWDTIRITVDDVERVLTEDERVAQLSAKEKERYLKQKVAEDRQPKE